MCKLSCKQNSFQKKKIMLETILQLVRPVHYIKKKLNVSNWTLAMSKVYSLLIQKYQYATLPRIINSTVLWTSPGSTLHDVRHPEHSYHQCSPVTYNLQFASWSPATIQCSPETESHRSSHDDHLCTYMLYTDVYDINIPLYVQTFRAQLDWLL